ncbi:hypothetical protein L248_2855 [Schleiferilactobacillus shenzhenensis LY-73]|uniref:GNAT-like C-terminal domain-containing protein n=2 Tax=Schleiferilactobacillus shenzhenensis TaxID=1231337 RepID=U4TP06_9LACO|nr:hypothetical protein L248_2855 [Schleiferilactobacillus shenzhenensis LY-73]
MLTLVNMPPQAQEQIRNQKISFSQWQHCLTNSPKQFIAQLLADPALALTVLSRLAAEDDAYFPAHGLSQQVYIDSYRDLTIWAEDHHAKTGVWGITEVPWLTLTLQHKLFRLGRLQFEPLPSSPDPRLPQAAENWLNVHIPADGPLLAADCDASFQRAQAYFHQRWFCCHSWLLAPALQQLLPATSHIIQFQERFSNVAFFPDDRQAEERIFGGLRDDPGQYPTHTELQRTARRYLLSGQKIGTALGFFHLPA